MKHVSEILPAIVKGHQLPLRKSALKLAEAAVAMRQEPVDCHADLAFMARELVQCTLPHSDPGDPPRWIRTNGRLTLTLVSSVGYPYGSIPRLLLFWLTREAVKTQSRRIRLGSSYYEFLQEVGLDPKSGGPRSARKRVEKQVRRLFGTMISFSTDGNASTPERRINMAVVDGSQLWWNPRKPEQGTLWESWVELGEKFFQAITEAPVPLDCRALKALKKSPLALDLYAWITRKVYAVKQKDKPQFVPWKGLHAQFGGDYGTVKNFRQKAMMALQKIMFVYPELKLEYKLGGLVILPASRLAIPC